MNKKTKKVISPEKWKWYGSPGHCIIADACVFHLHTKVGKYRVSTVGEYYPNYNRTGHDLGEMETVGYKRKYETMVFKCSAKNEVSDWGNIDFDMYNEREEADKGHMKMCRKYARK